MTKPELELNKKEVEEVKKVARDLLHTLKREAGLGLAQTAAIKSIDQVSN